ncbi:16S rRNA (cytosine(1402)-N(4))-methyltransferase RsmH [Rhodomicrobium lacus]|uniref:16S rRNA (cytosine(1402)-N(4))-methyltransferase RsmH n=1 Tax=Rhodomicrobium lacus TaxID=2498452 RepID=UPI0026E3340F|nr:16S rRNA (cytosine(1402)-N(4))-methyltransferase RsmH [Rhodomicrobium lacus]WKW52162.1 16S rRNA (cytosine(1402)-N(4))-methyltransferase RsmH [Rhodomicrobium lacus]
MKRRKRGGNRDVADRGRPVEGPSPDSGPVRHIPVLLREVLEALHPGVGERFIDGTFGAGGYARAILEAAHCDVLGLDRDPTAIAAGCALEAGFAGRLKLAETPFSEMEDAAHAIGWKSVDGVVLDLGVSSMQLDEAERGFSFMRDGPLDMRMSASGLSAADIVNTYEKDAIADILYTLGEERRSRAIAAAIVKDRETAPFERTGQLAALIARVLGHKPGDPKHPATRSFQALRLYVNDELGELTRALEAAERMLKPGGRLVVVSFHSLEDRIVKRFLAERSGKRAKASRYIPDAGDVTAPTFELRDRHGVEPSEDEVAANPRARSARLRWAARTAALARS